MGDWVTHCVINSADILHTLRSMANILSNLDGIPIIPVLGNNDIHPHNSMTDGKGEFLERVSKIWHNFLSEEQQAEFSDGGFYSIYPVPGLKILVMNTLFYYEDYCPYNTTIDNMRYCIKNQTQLHTRVLPDDPSGQFNWMNNQLELSKQNGDKYNSNFSNFITMNNINFI